MLRSLTLALCFGFGACSSGGADNSDPGPKPPPVLASDLPLLAPGLTVGVIYSSPKPSAQVALDTAYGEALSSGADGYELALAWSDMESAPGIVDVSFAQGLLDITQAAGVTPYVVLTTIDTVQLSCPPDLLDPGDSTELAAGLTWDHPALLARFEAVLDQLVPLLVDRGGFYLAVGNEVNAWLGSRPDQVAAYVEFVARARAHAHDLEERLGVGVAVTESVLHDAPQLFGELQAACDRVAFTYYPLQADFSVRPVAEVAGDLAAMRLANGPGPLLLQEVGYPAGWSPTSGNGSSEAAQRDFVEAIYAATAADPEIRFVSFLQLADWTSAELDGFEDYYGVADPLFREYLGTLGMVTGDGVPKAAWAAFLAGL